jgi:potassium uptake TrkH family protein
VPLSFLAAIVIGTLLLVLPVSRAGPDTAPVLTALFTATSAVCVTGLIVVDTPTYWSGFGQGVILALIQIGGFGIMTGSTLLGLLISRRLRLTSRLIVQAETPSMALGDVAGVLRLVLLVTVGVELATAAILTLHLRFSHGQPWDAATWSGLFHAISAFNNAGFSIYSDSLIGFAVDPLFIGPIMVGVVLGGLGFPVLYELYRKPIGPGRWSVHTKITLLGTAVLLVGGLIAVLAFEWSNPGTLGPLDLTGKLLGAMFHSVMTRTAGFNAVDIGLMRPETLAVSDALMLIGGGSASTAGGIKVTTFFLLGYVVWAEIRGEPDVSVFGRRLPADIQRQALTVVLLAVGLVAVASLILLTVTNFSLDVILFETVSAFATVGLSTGITDDLPPTGQLVIVLLMFVGRVGTITAAAALALRRRQRPFRYPEERPIVG